MIQRVINHRFVKRFRRYLEDRPGLDSRAEEIACSVSLLAAVLFSNATVSVLSIFVFFLLVVSPKAKKLPWPYLILVALQFSSYAIYVFLGKMQIYFWQGFFLKFRVVYEMSKKLCLWNETLFVVLPFCLGLIFLGRKKITAAFFFLCAIFSQIYFLPIIGIMVVLKVKPLITILTTLWLVENYVCSLYILQLPAYVQWIDVALLVTLFPIAVIALDVPGKIRNLRRLS